MRKIDGVPMRREPEDDLLGKLRALVAEDERVAALDGAAWQLAGKLDQLNRPSANPIETPHSAIIVLPVRRS